MNRYEKIIVQVFQKHYKQGSSKVPFERADLEQAARELSIETPKNLGDIVYSFRFRGSLPASITTLAPDGMEWVIRVIVFTAVCLATLAPDGMEWVIRGAGKSNYAFELVKRVRIVPNEDLIITKIPDSTPEIIASSAQSDEQALLALVRYNRLVDVFLGLTSYSLQNHLRTTVPDIGQIEIDEIYVAVDRFGQQYIIPVQAKGHGDEIGVTQPEQDLAACAEKWPDLVARSVAVQFAEDGVIVLFELVMQDEYIKVAKESHYRLVPCDQITTQDRALYRQAATHAQDIVSI